MSYNLLTGKGFITATSGANGWFGNIALIKARLAMVFIIFLMAILNKWVFGMFGMAFNSWIAMAGGVITYIIVISIFGAFKIAFAIGLVAGIILGILGGSTVGSTTDNE